MKASFKYFVISAFAILLCSCNKEMNHDSIESQVQISAKIYPHVVTRVSDDGTSFMDGDAIKVQNVDRLNKNLATYTYTASTEKWNTSDQLFWEGSTTNTFNAWYPSSAEYASFDIPSDQAAGTSTVDWMTATASAKKSDGYVELAFNHNLAKVTVTIEDWSNEYAENEKVVNSLELKSLSSVVFNDGTISGDNVAKWVKTFVSEINTTYVAILAPGVYAAGEDIIQVYVNGASTPLIAKTASNVEIESGKAYNFKLTIGKDLAAISSSVSIGEWNKEALEDQVGEDIIYKLAEDAPLNYSLQFGSSNLRIPFLSNVGTDITILYDGSESDWITYDNNLTISSHINDLLFSVSPNKSTSTRTARILLSNSYVNKSITLNVSQTPFSGLDGSNLNENKYITYVEDYEYVGGGTAFDYDMYDYGTTIYSIGLARSSKIECKFCLNYFTEGAFYISVGEYDDSLYKIYLNQNGLNFNSRVYKWADLGVSMTSVITLTLFGTTMIINGKTIEGIPHVSDYLDGYIWSGHFHERDDGMWWQDYTFQDGARIYYAKGWDSNGRLIYIGGASLSGDGRACWQSQYYDSGSGDLVTKEHFPRTTKSFGIGNL